MTISDVGTESRAARLAAAQGAFRDELVDASLLVRSSVDGIYGRSGQFEDIVDGIERMVTRIGVDQNADRFRFPAVFPRAIFEHTDYIASFPNLTGAIFSFSGDDKAHARLLASRSAGEDWSGALSPTDLMMISAACHPVYPQLAGTLPEGGRRVDVLAQCFRHEPSVDPARMQTFRQREYVYVGEPENARAHRELWIERGLAVLTDLQLPAEPVIANDPFFGRAGRMLAANQRTENLKTELVVRLYGDLNDGTACVSCNCHLEHFGAPFGITTAAGEVAHSACVGFGLERITLALLRTHGLDVSAWPAGVREKLWP
jgi:seryl-tRNA synthetase